jgi:hypothetical protein
MARFKHSVVINRPVEHVFAFVSDVENDLPWSGGGTGAPEPRRPRPVPAPLSGCVSGSRGRRLDVVLAVTRPRTRPRDHR